MVGEPWARGLHGEAEDRSRKRLGDLYFKATMDTIVLLELDDVETLTAS